MGEAGVRMKTNLCYNNNHIDNECDLCEVIDYVYKSITPECDCFVIDAGSYLNHEISCHYAAFIYSQNMRGKQE